MLRVLFITAALAFFIMGCNSSSDSGSNSNAPDVRSLAGILADPPVEGARVALLKPDGTAAAFCGVNKNSICQDWSTESGNFDITVPLNEDLSGYYFVTYGGTDTVYGTNLSGLSLSSPLSLFDAGETVTVSPITSLVNSLILADSTVTTEEAVSRTAEVLTIPADSVANSAESAVAIKASYLIIKVAELINSEGAAEPIGKIAQTALENPSDTITDTAFLNDLLNNSGITEAGKIASVKAEIASINSLLSGISDSSDIAALAEQIVDARNRQIFNAALESRIENFPTAPAVPSANYYANVNSLYDEVNIEEGVVYSRFAADQVVRFIIKTDGFFSNYDNITGSSFSTHLNGLVPTGEAEYEAFVNALSVISKESIYYVNAPLGEPLGVDNAKRADYYFSSNIDVNYIARSLISSILGDTINDAIAAYVVKSYTIYGLHERAEGIANAYIKGSVNRVKAYRTIGHYTADYDSAAAVKYLDMAVAILDAMYDPANVEDNSNLADTYQIIVSSYQKAGAVEKAFGLRNWIITDILEHLSPETTPTRYTVTARLISALYSGTGGYLIPTLIAEGDLDAAMSTIDLMVDYVDNLEKRTTPPSINPWAAHILYYVNAAGFYIDAANEENVEAVKAKILAIFDKVEALTDENDPNGTPDGAQWMTGAYYGVLSGYVYWADTVKGLYLHNRIDATTPGELRKR
jgi:hypothetical protein